MRKGRMKSKINQVGGGEESISGNKKSVVVQVQRNKQTSKVRHILNSSSMRKIFYEIRFANCVTVHCVNVTNMLAEN